MARNDPTIYMRIPTELKEQLDAASEKNHRSLTAEVVARLQQSFDLDAAFRPVARKEIDELIRGAVERAVTKALQERWSRD